MKDNPYTAAIKSRKKATDPQQSEQPASIAEVTEPDPQLVATPPPGKKRGRPATGKRSDEGWIGRTYYVQRSTDLDVEEQLLVLKREGTELDKSELVDALLAAWVKSRKSKNPIIQIDEISPIQK